METDSLSEMAEDDLVPPEPEIVLSLRQLAFNDLQSRRERKRAESFDAQRVKLGELKDQTVLNEKAISGICSRIKRRKQADEKDMLALSNGFLQNDINISTFIKTTGAINILVKEFIGNDSNRQNLAGECFCNLSMGDEICCEKVAQFAGSYLTIYILNLTNFRLVRICLYILQNLVVSGDKPLKILYSQKLVKNLLHIMNHIMYEEIKEECNILLDIILTNGQHFLSDDDKESILQSVVAQIKIQSHSTKVYQNLYKILTIIQYNVNEILSVQLVEVISLNLLDLFINNRICNDIEALYMLIIRILSNFFCINDQNLVKFIEVLHRSNVSLSNLINNLSASYFGSVKEFLWFAGNIKNCENPFVQSFLHQDNLAENLKISKIFVL